MQALLIFLVAVLVLVMLGLYFPSKTSKTPQNSRDVRQGDTKEWIDEINTSRKNRR